MNTKAKGDKFEATIYDLIKKEIDEDRFFLRKEFCKVFIQKGYYSKDREDEIIVDVSVEVTFPGQKSYSMLVLIECKNHDGTIPVRFAEEFYTKIGQISGVNVKGILAATSSFQRAAKKFSKSKGIGLLRYFDQSSFQWVLPRSPSTLVGLPSTSEKYISQGLFEESFVSKYLDCYCYVGDSFTSSLNKFFHHLVMYGASKEVKKGVSKISNLTHGRDRTVKHIERGKLERICAKVRSRIGYEGGTVPLERLSSLLEAKVGLKVNFVEEVRYDHLGNEILGQIDFVSSTVTIFSDSTDLEVRKRFTLAHELGHWILGHSKYMLGEYCQAENIDFTRKPNVLLKDIRRMEWQANQFAACLLLPSNNFTVDFHEIAHELEVNNRGFGFLYLDDQRCNLNLYYRITDHLKHKYDVSRTVVTLRLKALGLLNDQRSAKQAKRVSSFWT